MRIFVIWLQSQKKHNVPGYQFWRNYWTNAITEAGHEWIETPPEIDWVEGLTLQGEMLASWQERIWYETLKVIQDEHERGSIDLCLSYLFPNQIMPSAIKEIQNLGIPCVNFFCDNFREFRDVPVEFHPFDLHWGPEPQSIKRYANLGLKYIFAPYPIWIPEQQRTCNHSEIYGVSFIGSRDIHRTHLLAKLIKLGSKIEIRGSGWQDELINYPNNTQDKQFSNSLSQKLTNQLDLIQNEGLLALFHKLTYLIQPQISDELFKSSIQQRPNADEYVTITQCSKVVLGINRYPSIRSSFWNPPTFIRLRDLEAPAMGGCYLTEYSQGLEEWFELGQDIETYQTPEEMFAKINELERDPSKRNKMRASAQSKVFNDLCFENTLRKIMQAL
jgi:hypothetical protein